MNFLAVTGRVRSDLGSFLPRAARAFEVFTNLLASGAGCVEIFLCVSLDLRSTAPPCRKFVTKLSEAVSQLGLIDRRGKLLGGEETLRLDCARLWKAPLLLQEDASHFEGPLRRIAASPMLEIEIVSSLLSFLEERDS